MLTVFKTTLEIADEQKVELQKGSLIVKVGVQEDIVTLWYICDPEAELVKETFYVIATGQQVPDTFPGQYIDSVQKSNGNVWHVFFKKRPSVQRGTPVVADPDDTGGAE